MSDAKSIHLNFETHEIQMQPICFSTFGRTQCEGFDFGKKKRGSRIALGGQPRVTAASETSTA